MIEIIGTELYQWDTGRSVHITGIEVDKVHFANKGDSKAVKMGVVDSQAVIPDYLLQTGKQLCVYAVANGVTIESKTFSVKNRERPEDYVYEDDQRNYIYELITEAREATSFAHNAAEMAGQMAQEAIDAAGNANNATQAANQAASSAVAAAETANRAATRAASLMVVGKASGTSIGLDDAIDQFLVGSRVFGKTTQAGTPTPEAPVDLVSIGDGGSITVDVLGENEAQSMTIETPNGLPGIPVSAGGNYTDASGRKWICDEIDFASGVYVQRVCKKTFDGTEGWEYESSKKYFILHHSILGSATVGTPYCSHFTQSTTSESGHLFGGSVGFGFYHVSKSVSEWKGFLSSQLANGTPVEFVCSLAKPIETPLSEEEIAAFNALHTYRGNTTISNDASAHMEIEYVMDAKKYIDSLMTGAILPATVE